jgi:hypothetical protein
MEITIIRQEHKPWGIDGHLYISRTRVCDTVEHPKMHLPAGEYQITNAPCVVSKSEESQNANKEQWILFPFRHGDGALASTHCEIIVGKSALPGVVTQSQAIYDRLYERLKKAFQRGTPIRLTIRG